MPCTVHPQGGDTFCEEAYFGRVHAVPLAEIRQYPLTAKVIRQTRKPQLLLGQASYVCFEAGR